MKNRYQAPLTLLHMYPSNRPPGQNRRTTHLTPVGAAVEEGHEADLASCLWVMLFWMLFGRLAVEAVMLSSEEVARLL